MKKDFLVFGVKSFTDMFGGAKGYIGQFNNIDELIELIEKKKEWIFEERIEGFNFIDLKADEIIADNNGYEEWDLFSELISWEYKDYTFDKDVLTELDDILKRRQSPWYYFVKDVVERECKDNDDSKMY